MISLIIFFVLLSNIYNIHCWHLIIRSILRAHCKIDFHRSERFPINLAEWRNIFFKIFKKSQLISSGLFQKEIVPFMLMSSWPFLDILDFQSIIMILSGFSRNVPLFFINPSPRNPAFSSQFLAYLWKFHYCPQQRRHGFFWKGLSV